MPIDYSNPGTPQPPSLGPFASAATGVFICAVLLLLCRLGMEINNRTVLGIMIPGMTTTCLLLFVAMGWIFLLFGRTKRKPRWIIGTGIAIFIAMLELLSLTYIAGQTH